jgi:hypothetical protein
MCEQDYSLKFPLEVILRTGDKGTLLLAFLFLIMLFWKVRSAWHHAANSDDLVASNSFSASQSGGLRRRNPFEQSRFSNSQRGEVIHCVFVLGPCS